MAVSSRTRQSLRCSHPESTHHFLPKSRTGHTLFPPHSNRKRPRRSVGENPITLSSAGVVTTSMSESMTCLDWFRSTVWRMKKSASTSAITDRCHRHSAPVAYHHHTPLHYLLEAPAGALLVTLLKAYLSRRR